MAPPPTLPPRRGVGQRNQIDTSNLAPLANQVAGHPEGVLTLQDGSLVVKPCVPVEATFYTEVMNAFSSPDPDPRTQLARWIPKFLGTLALGGKTGQGQVRTEEGPSQLPGAGTSSEWAGQEEAQPERKLSVSSATEAVQLAAEERGLSVQGKPGGQNGKIEEFEKENATRAPEDAVILENLTHPFEKANVLDVKLGTQLWDEDSSDEKRRRMDQVAMDTTSGKMGLRLTGFQVWDNATKAYQVTPKSFGKSISVSDLPRGFRLFFASPKRNETDDTNGVVPVPSAGESSSSSAASAASTAPSLPPDLMLPILRDGVQPALQELIAVVQSLEFRMRGGSLLVVYEGDEASLRAGLENAKDGKQSQALRAGLPRAPRRQRMAAIDSAIKDVDAQLGGSGETNTNEVDEGEQDDEEDDGALEPGPAILIAPQPERRLIDVRMIDFAHTRFVPGQGPDEGVLLGLTNTLDMVEGLVKDLESRVAGK